MNAHLVPYHIAAVGLLVGLTVTFALQDATHSSKLSAAPRLMALKVLPLKDQVVLVTGSSRGLGRAVAFAFARQGVLGLVINCLTHSDTLDDLLVQVNPHLTRVVVVKADVTNPNDVARLFETAKRNFGYPITTVVNNVLSACPSGRQGGERTTIDTLTWEAFDGQLRGNIQGALNTTKGTSALSGMREIGFGRIINISSGTATQNYEHMAHVSKNALLAFTHTAAAELKVSNITVNLVACSFPKQTDVKIPNGAGDPASKAPLRKSVGPEELADTVLFFASPWARGVTGQSIYIDEGLGLT